MLLLLDALPTLSFFGAQAAGLPLSVVSLGVAALAGAVIWVQGRKGWPRDAVFFGCNLHFLIAGPLLWALFLSGLSGVAQPILDNVLLGVPMAVLGVLAFRAWRGEAPWVLAVVACLAVAVAATDPQNYIRVISIPLGMVLLARLALSRLGRDRPA